MKRGGGFVEPAGHVERAAEVVVRVGAMRLERQRPLADGDCFAGAALFPQRIRETGERARIVRFEGEAFSERGDRFVEPIQFLQRDAEVEIKFGNKRIAFQGFGDELDSFFVAAGLRRQNAQEVKRIGIFGLARENLAVKRIRVRQAACLVALDGALHRLLHRHVPPAALEPRLNNPRRGRPPRVTPSPSTALGLRGQKQNIILFCPRHVQIFFAGFFRRSDGKNVTRVSYTRL